MISIRNIHALIARELKFHNEEKAFYEPPIEGPLHSICYSN